MGVLKPPVSKQIHIIKLLLKLAGFDATREDLAGLLNQQIMSKTKNWNNYAFSSWIISLLWFW